MSVQPNYKDLSSEDQTLVNNTLKSLSRSRLLDTIVAIGGIGLTVFCLMQGGTFNYIMAGASGAITYLAGTRAFFTLINRNNLKNSLQITEENREMQYTLQDLHDEYVQNVRSSIDNLKSFLHGRKNPSEVLEMEEIENDQ
jgi:hypothetical protein